MVKRTIITTLVLIVIPLQVYSGWVDDWIDQKTETSPGYFEGQKRGYFNGGSFSARWYNSNDFIASFNPPRVKTGCGGIDVFGGAVSFMDFDRLVQKLQTMLTNAPAVAFDIAFNTLCEPCAKSIKSFEAITDTLNQLQFNDCQASQVVVAKTFQGLGAENAKVRAMAESDFALTRGVRDLRAELTDIWKTHDNQQTTNDADQIVGCPAGIREVFATPGRTVLAAMAEKKSYPLEYIDLARGFTGDILISEAESENGTRQIFPLFVPPCEQNKPEAVENFFSGQAYRRPADGSACTLITDANANLSLWANNKLNGIVTKMRTGFSLSPEEETFINTLPVPAYSALKVAVISDQPGSITALLSNMTARAYAYGMMSDLYHMALQNITTSQSLISAQGQQMKSDCQMDLMTPAIAQTERLAERIQESVGLIQRAYAAMAGEVNTILEVSMRFEQFNRIARSQLSEVFQPSLVNRTMGSR
ncbi:conjugal transfer protein TraH [Candidatus Manganitrophus noduliformans]|nr:conjugal transfer protein TraH [Candidatus Manganitrophus noduliformans]